MKRHLLFLALIICWALMLSSTVRAEDLTLVREIYLDSPMLTQAKAMVQTQDGGFIITAAGGAAKISRDGSPLWQYVAPNEKGVIDYSDATLLSDDRAVLCGSAARPAGRQAPGVVTIISKDGRVLIERLLVPANSAESSISRLASCAAVDGQIILVGRSDQFTKNSNPPPPMVNSRFIWVVSLDESLKIVWERLIPVTEGLGPDPDAVGGVQLARNPGVLFTVKLFGKTKIIDMDTSGNIRSQNTITGSFTMIHPSHPGADVQMVSSDTSSEEHLDIPITVVTLNEKMQETKRVSENAPAIVTRSAFQSPNRSLLLFGSKYEGASYYAKVYDFDPSLKHSEVIDFPRAATSWRIDAAIATDSNGGFACVRSATSPAPTDPNGVGKSRPILAFIKSGGQ